MVVYVGHIISMLVFLAVIISAGYMLLTLKSSTLPACYLWVPRVVTFVLIMQSTIFLLLQADYVLGDHGHLITSTSVEDSARVLYDIFTGLALVTFATGLNVFFRWKRTTSGYGH